MEEIAKVPGVDVLFCGPFDLGNNLGRPILDGNVHEDLKKAIAKIQHVARDNNKKSGIYATSGSQAKQFAERGFQMVRRCQNLSKAYAHLWQISVVTDATSLPTYMGSALSVARGS